MQNEDTEEFRRYVRRTVLHGWLNARLAQRFYQHEASRNTFLYRLLACIALVLSAAAVCTVIGETTPWATGIAAALAAVISIVASQFGFQTTSMMFSKAAAVNSSVEAEWRILWSRTGSDVEDYAVIVRETDGLNIRSRLVSELVAEYRQDRALLERFQSEIVASLGPTDIITETLDGNTPQTQAAEAS
jgi:hypothetical protein